MTWVIQCQNISKLYKMGSNTLGVESLFKQLKQRLHKKIFKNTSSPQEIIPRDESHVVSEEQSFDAPDGYFWALKDISFEIQKGDRVGIIGPNGCGKSTLLKILSRIISPTQGEFAFRGTMVSLLEVGTGFHADLPGRDNIYLNCALNGLSREQTDSIFDEIVAFSELGQHINTPIKRYSSGMYMRLAFSIAAHLNADILLVDEALAVGDVGFQKKCKDKMLGLANEGRTLLFVSHDMEAVKHLCTHAILLEHGRVSVSKIQHNNNPEKDKCTKSNKTKTSVLRNSLDATKEYLLAGKEYTSEITWLQGKKPSFDNAVYLCRTSLLDSSKAIRDSFDVTEEITIEIEFEVLKKKWPVNVHVYIETLAAHKVFFTMDNLDVSDAVRSLGKYIERCKIYSPLLNEGVYRVEIVICTGSTGTHYLSNSSLCFEVIDKRLPNGIRGNWTREWFESAVRPRIPWTVEKLI